MCSISERNCKVTANGEWGETKAKEILSKRYKQVEHVNTIIDFMLNDKIPIEVKTCQIKIKTGQEKHPERAGRFILQPDQHNFLLENEGYYLFIVKDDLLVHGWKLIEANSVPYKRHWQWNKIIERR